MTQFFWMLRIFFRIAAVVMMTILIWYYFLCWLATHRAGDTRTGSWIVDHARNLTGAIMALAALVSCAVFISISPPARSVGPLTEAPAASETPLRKETRKGDTSPHTFPDKAYALPIREDMDETELFTWLKDSYATAPVTYAGREVRQGRVQAEKYVLEGTENTQYTYTEGPACLLYDTLDNKCRLGDVTYLALERDQTGAVVSLTLRSPLVKLSSPREMAESLFGIFDDEDGTFLQAMKDVLPREKGSGETVFWFQDGDTSIPYQVAQDEDTFRVYGLPMDDSLPAGAKMPELVLEPAARGFIKKNGLAADMPRVVDALKDRDAVESGHTDTVVISDNAGKTVAVAWSGHAEVKGDSPGVSGELVLKDSMAASR